jgi:hypothetical protein
VERFHRWFREEVIQPEATHVRRPPGPAREERYAGDAPKEPHETIDPATKSRNFPRRNEATAATDTDQMRSLRTQLQGITSMSGAEFERYMASVFEALGYAGSFG